MKIAYLIYHDITTNDGVVKKILTQTEEWARKGADVNLYCILPKKGKSILEAYQYEKIGNYISSRLRIDNELIDDMNIFNPDIVYFRYDSWNVTLNKILQTYKVIAEVNTNDLAEELCRLKREKTLRAGLRLVIYYLFRGKVLGQTKGIVTVTRELSLLKNFTKYKRPITYISNSIDIKKSVTIKDLKHGKVGLFFIGSPGQPWHGVDILKNMSLSMQDFDFHIVGLEGKSMNNIYYHGYLAADKYLEIIKKCNICVGSLAMYRNKMFESNSLKVREYIAYGYPVILGCEDVAFLNEDKPEWMKIINTENDLDINDIKDFILKMSSYILNEDDKKYISSEYNEKIRYDFMRKIVDDK